MRIACLGAVLMDQIARVERFPGLDDEVFVSDLKLMPGGSAANTAVLLSRLGFNVSFFSKVGNDAIGESLLADFEEEGVDASGIARSHFSTGTVFVAVRPDGERMMFAHSGASNDIDPEFIDNMQTGECTHLFLSGLENIAALTRAARIFNGKVILNPGALVADKKEGARELLKYVDILICSKEEAEKLSCAGERDTKELASKLHDLGPGAVVITSGQKDSFASEKDGMTAKEKTFKVDVVDTTGAGDAFCAGFLSKYLSGAELKDSVKFGNLVASRIISNLGARNGIKKGEDL